MIKSLLIFLCFISYDRISAQSLEQKDITGEWMCKEISLLISDQDPPEMKAAAEILKKGFTGSAFQFGADGLFNLVLLPDAPLVMGDLAFLNNKKWFFDSANHVISIGTRRENLMHISVKEDNGFLTFVILETPLLLRVERRK